MHHEKNEYRKYYWQRAEKNVPKAEIILYGSEARGEARADSDIDILILLTDYSDIQRYISERSEISGRLFELSFDLGVDISPLILPRRI